MPIIATNKKGADVELIEAGSYPARIYQMIHLGNIAGYQGQIQNKVRIGFELPTEMKVFNEEKGEQPRVMSKEYTLSFNEKANLRKLIDACDSEALKVGDDGFLEEFDIEQLIGKTCLITISHKQRKDGEGTYACISNETAIPKGMECAGAINPTMVLSYDNWNEEIFENLPDFLKEKIVSSDEYKQMKRSPDEEAF
jgi:hypothetical protein